MVLVSVVTSETSLLHSWLSPMRMAPSTHMYGVHRYFIRSIVNASKPKNTHCTANKKQINKNISSWMKWHELESCQCKCDSPVSYLMQFVSNKKKKCTNDPYLPYRTSSQSSFSHYQASWTFEFLHATFQQNDCTSSSDPVTLSEHQGHSSWNQTAELLCLASYQFEANQLTNVLTQDNVH